MPCLSAVRHKAAFAAEPSYQYPSYIWQPPPSSAQLNRRILPTSGNIYCLVCHGGYITRFHKIATGSFGNLLKSFHGFINRRSHDRAPASNSSTARGKPLPASSQHQHIKRIQYLQNIAPPSCTNKDTFKPKRMNTHLNILTANHHLLQEEIERPEFHHEHVPRVAQNPKASSKGSSMQPSSLRQQTRSHSVISSRSQHRQRLIGANLGHYMQCDLTSTRAASASTSRSLLLWEHRIHSHQKFHSNQISCAVVTGSSVSGSSSPPGNNPCTTLSRQWLTSRRVKGPEGRVPMAAGSSRSSLSS